MNEAKHHNAQPRFLLKLPFINREPVKMLFFSSRGYKQDFDFLKASELQPAVMYVICSSVGVNAFNSAPLRAQQHPQRASTQPSQGFGKQIWSASL